MTTIWTLGSMNRRRQFEYSGNVSTGATIHFTGEPLIKPAFFRAILTHFEGKIIPGGFSMTDPTKGGLGQWVEENSQKLNGSKLTPRHATFIAAILVNERLVTSYLKGNAIMLKFEPVIN